jgi:hypothetical protein
MEPRIAKTTRLQACALLQCRSACVPAGSPVSSIRRLRNLGDPSAPPAPPNPHDARNGPLPTPSLTCFEWPPVTVIMARRNGAAIAIFSSLVLLL